MARTEVTGKQIKDKSVELADDVTGVLPVANGGSGSDTLPIGNALLGNGTGALQTVAPGTSGNVLTSNGSTWVSAAPTGGGGGGTGDVTLDGTQTLTNKTISGSSNTLSDIPQSAVIDLGTDLAAKQDTAEKGQPDGYPSLDSNGKVPTSQLPLFGAVDSVNGQTGAVVLTKSDVGLGNVDNTADIDKPVSLATLSALDGKQDIADKGQPGGYASLDSGGKVPVLQLPDGIGGGIDSVQVTADALQFYSGSTPVGDPISLLVSAVDGGTPSTVTSLRIDGGLIA